MRIDERYRVERAQKMGMKKFTAAVSIALILLAVPAVFISCSQEAEQPVYPEVNFGDIIYASMKLTDEGLAFQIPYGFSNDEWLVNISGRIEFDDGTVKGTDFLTEESYNRSWEAGNWYVIELTDPQAENITELEMIVSWFHGDGRGFVSGFALMPLFELLRIDD